MVTQFVITAAEAVARINRHWSGPPPGTGDESSASRACRGDVRRGRHPSARGYAVTFAGNMPGTDIFASDAADTRRISIQVKSKSSGSWHARFPKEAASGGEDPAESSFWVFVDLGGEHPA